MAFKINRQIMLDDSWSNVTLPYYSSCSDVSFNMGAVKYHLENHSLLALERVIYHILKLILIFLWRSFKQLKCVLLLPWSSELHVFAWLPTVLLVLLQSKLGACWPLSSVRSVNALYFFLFEHTKGTLFLWLVSHLVHFIPWEPWMEPWTPVL